jgi:RNA-directed DNA polymerase
VLDSASKSVSITPYSTARLEEAADAYTVYEQRTKQGEPIEAVLVSAGPIGNLRKAYPNYFLDTAAFIRQIEKLIAPYAVGPKVVADGRPTYPYRLSSYRHFHIRKRSGGHRLISVPSSELMQVQRWIVAHILNSQPVHHCSFAFKPTSSILKCAARHTGASWLIKMDVAGFFGSISEIQVYRAFRNLGYQPLISFELARLTTHPSGAESSRYRAKNWRARKHSSPITSYASAEMGYLPQGAPTSPMLSNIVMREADELIDTIARSAGLRYTRYSDDLTFSTTSAFSREKAIGVIRRVSDVLWRMGLRPNPRKTVVVPPGGRKVVLGLLVDGDVPRLTKDFRSLLRQHLHYLEKYGPMQHASARGFDSVWGMHRHIRGLIDFAKMVDCKYANALLDRFNKINWPSS